MLRLEINSQVSQRLEQSSADQLCHKTLDTAKKVSIGYTTKYVTQWTLKHWIPFEHHLRAVLVTDIYCSETVRQFTTDTVLFVFL